MWNANLLEFYLRVIVKLHDGLKVPFALEQGQFRVDETPVHNAVREALVNALIHADYQGTTGLRVDRHRSSFEFINPGLLLVTPQQVWTGGISEPRNPALQRLFGLLRLGEREGSGGPTIRRVWREQHWRAPRIWEDVEHGETHLLLPQESLLPSRAVDALVERLGEDFTGQDELGRVILVAAEAERTIHHARVRELSDAHPHDITLKLQDLVRRGLLESSGKTRGTTYSPATLTAPPFFANIPAQVGGRPGAEEEVSSGSHLQGSAQGALDSPPNGDHNGTNSPQRSLQSSPQSDSRERESSLQSSAQSDAPGSASSPQRSPQSDDQRRTSSPQTNDDAQSWAVRRVASSKWASAAHIREAILIFCRDDYCTVSEIAAALNRKPVTIQQNYISGMTREGLLEARYPQTPTHPAQAYRAAGEHPEHEES